MIPDVAPRKLVSGLQEIQEHGPVDGDRETLADLADACGLSRTGRRGTLRCRM